MKTAFCWIFGILSILPFSELQAQYFNAEVYKDLEQMPSNRIVTMTQQANGAMWFVTQNGVASYDGLYWDKTPDSIDYIPTLGQLRIMSFPDESVYLMGCNNTQFTFVANQNGRWAELSLPKSLEKFNTGTFYATTSTFDETPVILVGKDNCLFTYKNDKWSETKLVFNDSTTKITCLQQVKDSLWVGTNEGIYLHHDSITRKIVNTSWIFALESDSRTRRLYYMEANKLSFLALNTGEKEVISEKKIGISGLDSRVNLMVYGKYVFYSFNSPLYRHNTESLETNIILTQGYDDDYVCIKSYFDQERNLWVATLRGAFKINNLNIYSYDANTLLENEVSAALENGNGDIYLGSNKGLSVLSFDGKTFEYELSGDFARSRIMDIVEYQDQVYMAATTAGIVSLRDGAFRKVFQPSDKSRIYELHVHDDTLYASSGKTIYQFSDNTWQPIITLEDSTGTLHIRKIGFEKDFKYVFTTVGIYDFLAKKWIKSDKADENNIYCYVTHNREIFLGTSVGVRKLEGDKIEKVSDNFAEIKEPIYAFLKSKDGVSLWVGTGSGVYFSHFQQLVKLSTQTGLAGNEVNRNAFQFVKNGKIMIGTEKGVSFVDPVPAVWFTPIPKVEITGYSISDTFYQNAPATISYNNRNLKFHFRAISFFNENQIEYRTQLEGLESEWQDGLFYNQRTTQYNNLKPGIYKFNVQARVNEGKWSETTSSGKIKIESAFYQRVWFLVLIVILVILAIVGLARIRNRRLKNRTERLEQLVQEKTRELNERNDELVNTIKELKSAQSQIIQSEKLASMGHLTAGIAHELNNPLNYIRGGAECIIKNIEELNALFGAHLASSPKKHENIKYLMDESESLAESILTGASKSTEIIKSLNSFTADSQHYYSFTDLENGVETALTLLGNQFGFHITINRMFGNVPPVECYPAKINQLIVNLLLNGIQAIQGEGQITVRIFRKDAKFVCLEIVDNGIGIKPEDFDKVFEPFFTTKESNSGLGLTISEAIVQEHHGKIKIFSKPDEGTKVAVWLPVNQEPAIWDNRPIDPMPI